MNQASNHAALGNMETPVRRGPGRPPGSLNRPKPPSISPERRRELMGLLALSYREAVTTSALADVRVRGVRTLIVEKLGREGLAEIEAFMGAPFGNDDVDVNVAGNQECSV